MASKHASPGKRKSAGTAKKIVAGLPVQFALSPEQAARLKNIPLDSLSKFREGKAVAQDFTNVHLRLITGLYLCEAILHLVDDDASIFMPIQEGLLVNHAIKETSVNAKDGIWRASPVEIEIVADAIDIINQLQDQVTRRELRDAFRKAQAAITTAFEKGLLDRAAFMKSFVGPPLPKELRKTSKPQGTP